MMMLGCRPDSIDARDLRMCAGGTPLPSAASLRRFVPFVFHQGNSNSCVANAVAMGLAVQRTQHGGGMVPSRLFLYWHSRLYHFEQHQDEGTHLRCCIAGVRKYGAPVETAWPFDLQNVNRPPSWRALRHAFDARGLRGYYRCQSLDEVKRALVRGFPVAAGWKVHRCLQDPNGPIEVREWTGAYWGGHAMLIVGYDDERDALLILNSWGDRWRDGGFFWLDYKLAKEFHDAWAIDCSL